MFNIRKAIKQFKADFVVEPDAPSTRSLRSDKSSSRTASEDVSIYGASLTRSPRNTVNRDESPIIPVEHADSFNPNEAVSPLQKRSLLTSQWQESRDAHYDARPKSPVDFSMPSNTFSSKTTNGDAVSSTSPARKIPESLSNFTSLGSSEADDAPMESNKISVTQASQRSHEAPYDDPVVQITMSTTINDRNTLETKERLDPALVTQPLPLKLFPRPKRSFTRENSIPEDFPLDRPSTSSFLIAPSAAPITVSSQVPETVEQPKTPWSPKPYQFLQPIGESSDSTLANSPSALSPEDALAQKMEDLGKARRMESLSQWAQSKASHPQRPPQPIRTAATPKPAYIHQEDSSLDTTGLLEAYKERQQELQTQVDKTLAELREAREENKRLTNENQSQHHSILPLKIALYEVKHVQDASSLQMENQLRDALTSLTALKKEKKGWQDELDSMQHKLIAAERQIRCLDHLTRHKFEVAGQLKRRGLFGSVPTSTGIVGAMVALNEEIFQTSVQLAGSLKRMKIHSNRHKLQAQNVLGGHLTALIEDQTAVTTSHYNTLLMQIVLEVFIVHWCSSIIQAFYPKQESFADMLVQLSAPSARTSESSAVCGGQIRLNQHTPYPDKVKFNEWVTDVIKELDFILMVAGVRMGTHSTQLFYTKTLTLVKAAYDLRIAMAEQDIYGGLEVVIVPPDTPYQENWMLDAHADPTKDDAGQLYVDFVAGTSGIGLQRKVSERVEGRFQSKMKMELKPKVILAQVLKRLSLCWKVAETLHSSPTCATLRGLRLWTALRTHLDTGRDTSQLKCYLALHRGEVITPLGWFLLAQYQELLFIPGE